MPDQSETPDNLLHFPRLERATVGAARVPVARVLDAHRDLAELLLVGVTQEGRIIYASSGGHIPTDVFLAQALRLRLDNELQRILDEREG